MIRVRDIQCVVIIKNRFGFFKRNLMFYFILRGFIIVPFKLNHAFPLFSTPCHCKYNVNT